VEALHLLEGLDWQGALNDVNAAAVWLKSQGCIKVAVVGFSMGGALALAAAAVKDQLDACITFYGWNVGLADVTAMKRPVQCHFGELDDVKGVSDPATAATLEENLRQSGCSTEFFRYEGQGHGFMNTTEWGRRMQSTLERPPVDEAVCSTAMQRVTTFLQAHILHP